MSRATIIEFPVPNPKPVIEEDHEYIDPVYGVNYWLGYVTNTAKICRTRSVNAVYLGSDTKRHLFYSEHEGDVEIYSASLDGCIVKHLCEGNNPPKIAIKAKYRCKLDKKSEKEYALNLIRKYSDNTYDNHK